MPASRYRAGLGYYGKLAVFGGMASVFGGNTGLHWVQLAMLKKRSQPFLYIKMAKVKVAMYETGNEVRRTVSTSSLHQPPRSKFAQVLRVFLLVFGSTLLLSFLCIGV